VHHDASIGVTALRRALADNVRDGKGAFVSRVLDELHAAGALTTETHYQLGEVDGPELRG